MCFTLKWKIYNCIYLCIHCKENLLVLQIFVLFFPVTEIKP